MSIKARLDRIRRSWKGQLFGTDIHYTQDDAFLILTEMGLQMSPATLSYLTGSAEMLEEFLEALHLTEKEIKAQIVVDGRMIDPEFDPKVYEVDGEAIFTLKYKGVEMIMAEIPLPHATPHSAPDASSKLADEVESTEATSTE